MEDPPRAGLDQPDGPHTPFVPFLQEITMKKIPAALLLISIAACSSPLDVAPNGPADAALSITNQAKPVTSLVIELVSGDCASGITVRVRGENLSAKSRFGNQWLDNNNLTSFGPAQVALGTGSKKSVEWTTFWPSATINPAAGPKFNGYARGVVTDAWTGWLYDTGPTPIGPAC
jgi:hypothetical protein